MLTTNPVTNEVSLPALGPARPEAPADDAPRAVASSRGRKFLSYYKPYPRLFLADMACALVVSATLLLLPLCARYVTKDLLGGAPHALSQIALMGALMLALVGIQTLCTLFIDYQGHMMGARMEADMRR
ncbi:MAG: hypothetical protein ACRDID_01685 [Ktedonobacterales bacterium]